MLTGWFIEQESNHRNNSCRIRQAPGEMGRLSEKQPQGGTPRLAEVRADYRKHHRHGHVHDQRMAHPTGKGWARESGRPVPQVWPFAKFSQNASGTSPPRERVRLDIHWHIECCYQGMLLSSARQWLKCFSKFTAPRPAQTTRKLQKAFPERFVQLVSTSSSARLNSPSSKPQRCWSL